MKILIAYPAGCYGNLIAWLLLNADKKLTDIELPFTQTGNAHKFYGNVNVDPILEIREFNEFIKSDKSIALTHNIKDLIPYAIENFKNDCKIISIGFDRSSQIWVIDNTVTKIFKDHLSDYGHKNMDFGTFVSHHSEKLIEELAPWEIRELLSFYLDTISTDGNLDYTTTKIIPRSLFNNVDDIDYGIFVDIKELRDNFISTVKKILNYCDVSAIDDTLIEIEQQWRSKQYHLYKDKLINDIVNKISNNIDFTIDQPLTNIDEAFIQQKLRQLGIELRCYNLDQFPSTNKEFQSLLFYNFDTLVKNNFNNIVEKVYNKQLTYDQAMDKISNILRKL